MSGMAVDGATPILVVDPNEVMARIARELLSQLGFYDVETARNAEEARDMGAAKRFALVIGPDDAPALGARRIVVAKRDGGESVRLVKPFNAAGLMAKIEEAFSV